MRFAVSPGDSASKASAASAVSTASVRLGARKARLFGQAEDGDLRAMAGMGDLGNGVRFLDQQEGIRKKLRFIRDEIDAPASGMRPLLRSIISNMTKKSIDDSKLPVTCKTVLTEASTLVGKVDATMVKLESAEVGDLCKIADELNGHEEDYKNMLSKFRNAYTASEKMVKKYTSKAKAEYQRQFWFGERLRKLLERPGGFGRSHSRSFVKRLVPLQKAIEARCRVKPTLLQCCLSSGTCSSPCARHGQDRDTPDSSEQVLFEAAGVSV